MRELGGPGVSRCAIWFQSPHRGPMPRLRPAVGAARPERDVGREGRSVVDSFAVRGSWFDEIQRVPRGWGRVPGGGEEMVISNALALPSTWGSDLRDRAGGRESQE
jgi:hypothetical protein